MLYSCYGKMRSIELLAVRKSHMRTKNIKCNGTRGSLKPRPRLELAENPIPNYHMLTTTLHGYPKPKHPGWSHRVRVTKRH